MEIVNVQINTWTEIGAGNFSWQTLGDRGIYYTEASVAPTGEPVKDVPANYAFAEQRYNFRASGLLSRLFVYTTTNNGSNIAIDKPTYEDVYVQDQNTSPVEHWLTYQQEEVFIQENVIRDSNTVVLNAGAGSTITNITGGGYYIEIRYYNPDHPGFPIIRFYQGGIVTYTDNITTVTIELDTPLDFTVDTTYIESVYIADANASRVSQGATITNRLKMCAYPPDNLSWDLTRIMVNALLISQPDDGKFFDRATPLTWGIYFGAETSITKKYLANVKTNAGFGASAYDVAYTTRTVPQGSYGMRVRKSFGGQDKYGVVVRLNGNTERFCVYLQEPWNLNADDDCRFKIMGHEVD